MISDLCKGCIHCIKYGYMHYSMSGGKKILIDKCFKCEKTIDMNLDIAKCGAFKEKPKSNSKSFKEAKKLANKGKPPRKQPKKKPGEFGYARQVRMDIKKNLPKKKIFD